MWYSGLFCLFPKLAAVLDKIMASGCLMFDVESTNFKLMPYALVTFGWFLILDVQCF